MFAPNSPALTAAFSSERARDVWIPIRRIRGQNTNRAIAHPGQVTWDSELLNGAGKEKNSMLWTIFVILLVLWLLGLVTSYTLGGFIHILLVIAIVVALIQIISGRRVV
ncbi:MAG TPA: lmo0937 family membrane protein [Bryobacteraceae bacterium]|nr:lmo0937 family membrane protein [Bryobacteraceae bacterium]